MRRRLSRGLIARSARASLCVCFAPERPFSPGRVLSLAFLAALAPLPLRRSVGGVRGVRSGIWRKDRRRASLYLHPHLSDLMTALRDRKPALRLLPLGQRPRRFSCLPRSAERPVEPQRGKLDERFLRFQTAPPHRSLPFFPDLHTEVSRSWGKPFSARLFVPLSDYYGNVAGTSERGYRAMPRVEQTRASYLSPDAASSLKAPTLPTKPLRTSSALVGKGYAAAGQAGSCLHTMAVLQAYQADLLKELDEGEGFSADDIRELRRTADLSLRATKETARAIGRSMAALVAAERHLWLTLSDIKDRDRVFLLDAPLSPSGLFGDAVDTVVDRHQEAGRQAAAFRRFSPSTLSNSRGCWARAAPAACWFLI